LGCTLTGAGASKEPNNLDAIAVDIASTTVVAERSRILDGAIGHKANRSADSRVIATLERTAARDRIAPSLGARPARTPSSPRQLGTQEQMNDLKQELREALSGLLAATVNLDAPHPEGGVGLAAARENAARVLLLNRAQTGRPWATSPGATSFMDRWRALRGLAVTRSARASSEEECGDHIPATRALGPNAS
jgi:hypothetical protein